MNLQTKITFAFVFLFFWEHIAYVNDLSVRPTWALAKLVLFCETMFYYIGILFGHIGSLITYLHLDKLYDTTIHILKILLDLVMSVKYVKDGVWYVAEIFDNMYQVYTTSMFLFAVVSFVTTVALISLAYYLIKGNNKVNNKINQ